MAIYVGSMWALHRPTLASRGLAAASVAAIAAVLGCSLLGLPLIWIGMVLVVLIAVNAAIRRAQADEPSASAPA